MNDEATRNSVLMLAAHGMPVAGIAAALGITEIKVRKVLCEIPDDEPRPPRAA